VSVAPLKLGQGVGSLLHSRIKRLVRDFGA